MSQHEINQKTLPSPNPPPPPPSKMFTIHSHWVFTVLLELLLFYIYCGPAQTCFNSFNHSQYLNKFKFEFQQSELLLLNTKTIYGPQYRPQLRRVQGRTCCSWGFSLAKKHGKPTSYMIGFVPCARQPTGGLQP